MSGQHIDSIEPNAIEPHAIEPHAIEPHAIEPNAIEPNAIESIQTPDFEPENRIDSYPTHVIAGFGVRMGRLLPFGATSVPGGINFSVYANHATSMTLVLYRRGRPDPLVELPFPEAFRIGGVHSMTVFGLDPDQIEYGYRAEGPFRPEQGHRYDVRKVLADPYARVLGGGEVWGRARRPLEQYRHRSQAAYDDYDWEEDRPLGRPHHELVIYELHVRGFTRHPSSGVSAPGTFGGLLDKIPYLRELGVTCVELMPVFEFDETENGRTDPASGRRLHNYWGYSTIGFFAPKAGYAATAGSGLQMDELKNLIKHLHRAGIEVILDVVFNHTAEGNEQGPTISFRGLDNATYYLLTRKGEYYNFSGTGNTVNCNHPVVRGFVLDCLRYWAAEFHVDGFRFDLASVLGRSEEGALLPNPPLLESLANDPILRDCKLIAESWDAAGLYQVGSFSDYHRWSEWNGRYRDTVRAFLKGDVGLVGEVAARIAGSEDLYGQSGSSASVNFVTAHDGFTLADLVSYNDKHNEANGEDNRDGDNGNRSWNCGAEGPTDDPAVIALRARQSRNFLLVLLLSRGVPMLLAGDEAGRGQRGNNNAYCQDGPLSWFDWNLTERNADLVRFTRLAIGLRAAHRALRPGRDLPAPTGLIFPPISWHGVHAWEADWSDGSRLLAVMFSAEVDGVHDCVYAAVNAYWEPIDLELPTLPDDLVWHRAADTSAAPPRDIHERGQEPLQADQGRITAGGRSVVVLVARAASPVTGSPATEQSSPENEER